MRAISDRNALHTPHRSNGVTNKTRYLVWPESLRPPDVEVPERYALRTSRLTGSDREAVKSLLDEAGRTDVAVDAFRDRALPKGCFVAVERATNAVVGTCTAIHKPDAGAHHFPFGGELANLAVDSGHRRRGLGRALSAAATRRLLDAGYDSIRVGVAPDRRAALALYLTIGFAPYLLDDEDVGRWRDVFDDLGLPFDPGHCVRH